MSIDVNLMAEAGNKVMEKPVEAIETVVKALMPKIKSNVVLTICNNSYIKKLNTQYRNKNAVTDVLSFPLLMSDIPGTVKYSQTDFNPDTGELMLGDIIISLEKAESQAEKYGNSLERELCYLSVHSVLHLFGYDHMTQSDKKLMREKEEEILSRLNISK